VTGLLENITCWDENWTMKYNKVSERTLCGTTEIRNLYFLPRKCKGRRILGDIKRVIMPVHRATTFWLYLSHRPTDGQDLQIWRLLYVI
jgi:hypothetical protein